MSKANDWMSVYRYWLNEERKANTEQAKLLAQETFEEDIKNSPSYQEDALRNGESQPMSVTRENTRKARFTVAPGDDMHIGDLITVFGENWLCIELYIDEYGMKYGELWMCNHVFHYQDHDKNIIHKDAIIDDGSYTKGTDKALPITDNYYRCYISLDDESRALFVDKRLAIDEIVDGRGRDILEVGKISWIDTRSHNYGEGSHLMVFGLIDDPYNEEHDNIAEMICDYVEPQSDTPDIGGDSDEPVAGHFEISGRDEMRLGTERTYTVSAFGDSETDVELPEEISWTLDTTVDGVTITPQGASCLLGVSNNEVLVGEVIRLKAEDASGKIASATKEVVIIYG